MQDFAQAHKAQLELLNIPSPLYEHLQKQLEATFACTDNGDLDIDRMVAGPLANLKAMPKSDYGNMLVIPHVCTWDIAMNPSSGMWQALHELPVGVLKAIYEGLLVLWGEKEIKIDDDDDHDDHEGLMDRICDPRTWSRVILYRHRHGNSVRAALPAPPYFPQVPLQSAADSTEADLTGPFPFEYHLPSTETVIASSLAYLSPEASLANGRLPTLDLVPSYSCPDPLTRSVRYVALLGELAPPSCLAAVKTAHAAFVQRMHLVRQEILQSQEDGAANLETARNSEGPTTTDESSNTDKVWRVFTDANDPMELGHPQAGLTSSKFALTDSIEDADIIYSFRSLYAPSELRELLQHRLAGSNPVLINQFPYEGAFVQKDHLGREILKQHGLPRPRWSIETYDLDVQLTEFIGAAILATERGEDPVWIVKPAGGTQSKGHVVTRSTAQILRLVEAGGESRVVQRYISNPVCVDGRKVDCRCIVMMTSGEPGNPTLFMHNRVFFRIANKAHSITKPSNLMDVESVLTATHLINDGDRTSSNVLETLPTDHKTIAKLELDYGTVGFNWQDNILPKIKTMIRELFNNMTAAFPAMGESKQSRALYGVDVMFEVESGGVSGGVEVKLTEVTFCPSNNSVCDAYEKDEDLFRSYNNDVFSCLFLGSVSNNITKIE
jgi:hypothetical protein